MNPLSWSFRPQMLLGGITCLALVGFAFYTQLQWGLEPCELCIHQRIAYLVLAGTFFLAALISPRARSARRSLSILTALAALVGALIAGKQIWHKLFPPAMPTCAVSFDFVENPTLWQQLFTATVECGVGDWIFLGLSMPAWSLIWFVILGAWALHAGFKKLR